MGFSLDLFTAAINFLRSLLEPDPAKRPNIQQALANRWLNENYPGRAPPNVTYPNRYSGERGTKPAVVPVPSVPGVPVPFMWHILGIAFVTPS